MPLAQTRVTESESANSEGDFVAPSRSSASQAQPIATAWPSTIAWKRVVEWPGVAAIRTAEGPSAAKSQGLPVARLTAPTTMTRTPETIGTQTESAAAAG